MGAHSTPGTTGPTGLRIVTTGLAIAVTSVLGTGTAFAHDDAGHGEQHSTAAGHTGHHGHAGSHESMDDLLAEVGMGSWDWDWDSSRDDSWDSSRDDSGDSSGDSSWDDEGSDDTGHEASATRQVAAPAPARPATSTQPIAAPASTAPASTVPAELPAPGETQTIPIRGNR